MQERLDGAFATYHVVNRLGRGGFGYTWKAKVVSVKREPGRRAPKRLRPGTVVIIKTPRIDPSFSPEDIQERMMQYNLTIDREINARKKLGHSGPLPQILDRIPAKQPVRRDLDVTTNYLVLEFIEGEDLDVYLTRRYAKNGKKFQGLPSASLFFKFAKTIARVVKQIHERGVLHKDLWPKNILVKKNGLPVFIDFGSAIFRQFSFKNALSGGIKGHPWMAPERRSRTPLHREGRRSDIYSLGGILFFLATGKNPGPPIPDDDRLKDMIERSVSAANPGLIRQNRGIVDLIARCLRYRKENRIRNADQILNEIPIILHDRRTRSRRLAAPPALKAIGKHYRALSRMNDYPFLRIVDMDLTGVLSGIKDMRRGIYEVGGSREPIVTALCQFLSAMEGNDVYLDFSIPEFWAADNFGVNGRFLTMNELAAKRGTIIRRIFYVRKDELDNPTVRDIFAAQGRMLDRANAEAGGRKGRRKEPRVEICVQIIGRKRQFQMIDNNDHRSIFIKTRSKPLFALPVYDNALKISTVRFIREGEGGGRCLDLMTKEISRSQSLKNFLKSYS